MSAFRNKLNPFTQKLQKVLDESSITNLGVQAEDLDMGGYSLLNVDTLYETTNVVKVRNLSGGTLTKGAPVYITGEAVNLVTVANCDIIDKDKMPCVGIVLEDIADNQNGYIIIKGLIRMDTSGFTGVAGERVYIQSNGSLDTVEPTSGSVQRVGILAKKDSGNAGVIHICIRGRESIFASADEHPIMRMGNDTGHKKIEFRDYANNEKGNIDDSGNLTISGELKIKVYSQDAEPTLEEDQKLAMWIDTNDANRVYLIFRRGSADQVKIELT